VLAKVVAYMQSRHRPEREELLTNAGIVNLVNDNVELVYLCEGVHLQLPSPLGVLTDPINVIVYTFIIFNEKSVKFSVDLNVFNCFSPQFSMPVLVTQQLVRDGSEHAVSVSLYLNQF
jgi:hypothetical protein